MLPLFSPINVSFNNSRIESIKSREEAPKRHRNLCDIYIYTYIRVLLYTCVYITYIYGESINFMNDKKRIHEFHPWTNPWIQKRIRFFRAREREPTINRFLYLTLYLPYSISFSFYLSISIYFRLYLYHRFIIFNWTTDFIDKIREVGRRCKDISFISER